MEFLVQESSSYTICSWTCDDRDLQASSRLARSSFITCGLTMVNQCKANFNDFALNRLCGVFFS
ncbi:hypothetical protein T4A_10625 [Trichinella pseudospiralis]|uniref:Uncharacterized protein n=1 Tax=Trichinella pseudospiralis TaxID=6337 RepID=A0A0V1EG79_TRIPS|nr:hypothetical protein T4A_10625 [Trichinella pseudospiralis]